MLVNIGHRTRPQGLIDLLLDCHERIRLFSRLASTIGEREEVVGADLIEATQRCERYFVQALPLHVQDEEQSLLPRLRGRRPDVDAALDSMHAQHQAHGPRIDAMLAALRAVRQQPGDRSLRAALHAAAGELLDDFEQHLSLEERVLFPAAREVLSRDEQQAIVAELRARRA